jgi:GPH family glycoside/pentoside/hexuronide:cation symporter
MGEKLKSAVILPSDGLLAASTSSRGFALKLFYGIGAIPFGVKDNGFQVLLLLFYNQAMGLSAGLTGLAIFIALIVDAFVDPTIGYLSDRVRSSLGRRHPFMYAAAVPASLTYAILFMPPTDLSQPVLFGYLVVSAILVRMCISCYEIPSSALAPELTPSYDERTVFISFRYFFGWCGGLSMSVLAFSVFLQSDGLHKTALFTPTQFRYYGESAALIILVAILLSAFGTQAAVRPKSGQVFYNGPRINILRELWLTIRNRSALSVFISGTLMMLATGLSFALGTYFNLYAWDLSASQISVLTAGAFISAGLALLIAPWLSHRFDKRGAAIRVACVLFFALPFPLELSLTGYFPTMASGWMMPFLFVYNTTITTLLVIVPILLASMLADVVEEIEVNTGRREEGVIFAINTFMAKWATGFAIFLSTLILSWAKFPADANASNLTAPIIYHLSEIYIGVVMALYVGSIVAAGFYAITREKHLEYLRILAERKTK